MNALIAENCAELIYLFVQTKKANIALENLDAAKNSLSIEDKLFFEEQTAPTKIEAILVELVEMPAMTSIQIEDVIARHHEAKKKLNTSK